MKRVVKQRLTKVALAMVIAGYCSIPAAIAADERGNLGAANEWQVSGSTANVEGTVPWIATATGPTDKDHVTIVSDYGTRNPSTPAGKQFHIGDKLTVSWAIGDEQGDTDKGANNTGDVNALTKGTVVWVRSKSQDGTGAQEISGTTGKDVYTITDADADYYIGIKITPTTSTGTPNAGTQLVLTDLSSSDGGGSDSDDIPTGPVVDDSVKVMIYDSTEPTVDLLASNTVKLHTEHTYKARLYKDKDNSNTFNTGDEDVTNKYDYKWVFTGTSMQLGTAGGDSSVQNADLVIPATNTAATSIFNGAGADGVQGYGLSIKYKRNDN
ncbi:intimin-like protein SinH [Leminorella richardii]|uniref:Intimin-like protein SinH n=1 Tax=Leminorella richardii TaxID=158841 RepID=A0A2X4V894_9GAMM|nr:SinI family autotransporter-associated protein [Leminorella richardii]SQI41520.1 intimin-like protein SinH [Leminorella richardii]